MRWKAGVGLGAYRSPFRSSASDAPAAINVQTWSSEFESVMAAELQLIVE